MRSVGLASRLAVVVGFVALLATCGGDEPSTADAERLSAALLGAASTTTGATATVDPPVRPTSTTSRTPATLPAVDRIEPAATTLASTTTTPATLASTTATPATLPPTTPPALPPLPAPPAPPGLEGASIEIPAIGLARPLYEGIELDTLDLGPGHWPSTALPGQQGNVVIAGHRVSHNADFRHLDALAPGDDVVFTTSQGRFVYRVVGVEIVPPDALWIIEQGGGHTATLFACHPPGSVRERIVVHLELSA
jgi:sortase A